MDDLARGIRRGGRRALARAITLVESEREADRERAEALIEALLPHTGGAVRLGISGAPGAGKSTFIEALGQVVVAAGQRIAVLAVDPSSRRGGGSVLADKTRMQELARSPAAFIRPSPAGDSAGGVARRTREASLLCEAAGFEVVVIETVGVGQAETAVADMVDTFLLLLAPGGGDELQGIKRGIVELADLLVVNKADGALADAAGRLAADYRAALGLLRPRRAGWQPPVLLASALEGRGIDEVWRTVRAHREALGDELVRLRARQWQAWLWSEIEARLLRTLRDDAEAGTLLATLEREVGAGRLLPVRAARQVVDRFRGRDPA
jgi:LAO/AO transport system kinase